MFAENLHSIDGAEFLQALDPDVDMEGGRRAAILRDSARAVAEFVLQHGTFEALRTSYVAGRLDGHAIKKGLRERFEAPP